MDKVTILTSDRRMLITKITALGKTLKKNIKARIYCLEEVFRKGQSLEYREFRLREAFGLLPKNKKCVVWVNVGSTTIK